MSAIAHSVYLFCTDPKHDITVRQEDGETVIKIDDLDYGHGGHIYLHMDRAHAEILKAHLNQQLGETVPVQSDAGLERATPTAGPSAKVHPSAAEEGF